MHMHSRHQVGSAYQLKSISSQGNTHLIYATLIGPAGAFQAPEARSNRRASGPATIASADACPPSGKSMFLRHLISVETGRRRRKKFSARGKMRDRNASSLSSAAQ